MKPDEKQIRYMLRKCILDIIHKLKMERAAAAKFQKKKKRPDRS